MAVPDTVMHRVVPQTLGTCQCDNHKILLMHQSDSAGHYITPVQKQGDGGQPVPLSLLPELCPGSAKVRQIVRGHAGHSHGQSNAPDLGGCQRKDRRALRQQNACPCCRARQDSSLALIVRSLACHSARVKPCSHVTAHRLFSSASHQMAAADHMLLAHAMAGKAWCGVADRTTAC